MKIEDRDTIKEALSFIKDFGEHRHMSKFPHECWHCILITKLKNILRDEIMSPGPPIRGRRARGENMRKGQSDHELMHGPASWDTGGKRKVEVQDESGTRLRLEVGRTETTNEEAEYQAYLANVGGPDPRD